MSCRGVSVLLVKSGLSLVMIMTTLAEESSGPSTILVGLEADSVRHVRKFLTCQSALSVRGASGLAMLLSSNFFTPEIGVSLPSILKEGILGLKRPGIARVASLDTVSPTG